MPNNTPSEKEIIDVPPEGPKKDESSRVVERVDTKPVTDALSVKQGGNVIIGTLNIFNAPVQRYLGEPLQRRYHRHYHPRHKHGTKHLVADILLAAAVLGLLVFNAYLFFFTGAPGLQAKVHLTVAVTPETIRSGDAITVSVSYENKNDVPLADARLTAALPGHTHPLDATPAASYDEKTHTFTLGTIEAGGNGNIRMSWPFVGRVGEEHRYSFALSYTSEGATRREVKTVIQPIKTQESALALTFDFPKEFVHEATVPFTIRYRNRGTRPLPQVRIAPVFDARFQLVASTPTLVENLLTVPVLAPGSEGTIVGRVRFTGDGATEGIFTVRTYLTEERVLQEELTYRAPVFYSKLRIEPRGEGTLVATLGTPLPIPFAYENGEEEDIVDLSLMINGTPPLFAVDATTILTHDKKSDPSLALIRARAKGEIVFTVPTAPSLDRSVLGEKDPTLSIPYTISYRLARSPQSVIEIERSLDVQINSDIRIDAFGRYFTPEGDQLGRGPLPPRVGETTRYWVFVPVVNSISDVENVVVTMRLDDGVSWTKKSSVTLGDPLVVDERTGVVTWRIPRVTKYSGGAYPDVGAALEVALTPGASHVGTTPVLFSEVRLRGRDTFTGMDITSDAPPVTTDLSVDRRAQGKGKVAP